MGKGDLDNGRKAASERIRVGQQFIDGAEQQLKNAEETHKAAVEDKEALLSQTEADVQKLDDIIARARKQIETIKVTIAEVKDIQGVDEAIMKSEEQ